jgi:hypothetical protein
MPDGLNRSDLLPGSSSPPRTFWTGAETVATAASVLWLLIVVLVWLLLPATGTPADPFRPVYLAVAVLMPLGMIWTAAIAVRAVRIAEDETRRLQYAIDSLRQSILADRQARSLGSVPPMPQDLPQRPTPVAPSPAPRSAAPQHRGVAEDQPRLALGEISDESASDLAREDLILALHFPDDDRDEAGFAALRRALKDRQTRQLVQASQDVLTLLSQDGIYMDDLEPDRARPEVWRRFAQGDRGRAVAALGGVHDRECLAITIARMREDAIFRDAAHHFLRLFDRRLAAFEPHATDEELVLLAETRTARAFMLLGRVTGIFD